LLQGLLVDEEDGQVEEDDVGQRLHVDECDIL
jgi:hypothetical protein